MLNTYFTADLHLGHRKILECEKETRPFSSVEEHDETLIENWNKVVRNRDTVWVLGDVFFGVDGFEKVKRLKGCKKLILGNHDSYSAERYAQVFNKVYGAYKFKKKFLLTHMPILHDHLDKFTVNIHGHIHRRNFAYPDNGLIYYNVGVDHHNLQPVRFPFEEFEKIIKIIYTDLESRKEVIIRK